MKQITLYTCECCGTNYADKSKAEECEKNHKMTRMIMGARYLPIHVDKSGFPLTVEIQFCGGERRTYKR